MTDIFSTFSDLLQSNIQTLWKQQWKIFGENLSAASAFHRNLICLTTWFQLYDGSLGWKHFGISLSNSSDSFCVELVYWMLVTEVLVTEGYPKTFCIGELLSEMGFHLLGVSLGSHCFLCLKHCCWLVPAHPPTPFSWRLPRLPMHINFHDRLVQPQHISSPGKKKKSMKARHFKTLFL